MMLLVHRYEALAQFARAVLGNFVEGAARCENRVAHDPRRGLAEAELRRDGGEARIGPRAELVERGLPVLCQLVGAHEIFGQDLIGFFQLVGDGLENFGFDHAGRDGVDGDRAFREFAGGDLG